MWVAKKTVGLALTAYAGFHGLGANALAIPVLLNSLEGWVTDPTKLTKENVQSALFSVVVEAAGVGLFGVLTVRKLLILGTATPAKKAPLPDPLYVYCTKILFALEAG
jgi:hypothetical protein